MPHHSTRGRHYYRCGFSLAETAFVISLALVFALALAIFALVTFAFAFPLIVLSLSLPLSSILSAFAFVFAFALAFSSLVSIFPYRAAVHCLNVSSLRLTVLVDVAFECDFSAF